MSVVLRCFLFLMIFVIGHVPAVEAQSSSVRLGILKTVGHEEDVFSPSIEVLKKAWEQPVVISYYDIPGLQKALAKGELEFFISNAGFFTSVQNKESARHLASLKIPQAADPSTSMGGLFFVRSDNRTITTFEDMAGKTAVAVSPEAFGGWRILQGEIASRGYDPDRFFSQVTFTGYPMLQVFDRIASGQAEVGMVRACLLEEMIAKKKISPHQFRAIQAKTCSKLSCLHSTALYPDWVFASTPLATSEQSRRAAAALLSMPQGNSAHWSIASDYSAVNKLFKTLKVGPYEYLRDMSPRALILRYRWWIISALGIILILVLHSVRVAFEVRRKTASLTRALEDREQAEKEKEQTEEKLRQLERISLVGVLSNMVAHELKQPLGVIGNFADGIRTLASSDKPDKHLIESAAIDIQVQTRKAGAIIEKVRDYARKDSVGKSSVSLSGVACDAVKDLRVTVKNLPEIRQELSVDVWTEGDKLELTLVVLNLLKNAVEATRGIKNARILVTTEQRDDTCELTVVNNGPCPNADVFKNLFEPKMSKKPAGLGIGLAIAARIIENHGGSLSVERTAMNLVKARISLPAQRKFKDENRARK